MSTLRENTSEQSKGDSLSRSLSHGQLTMIAMGLALGTGLFLGSSSAIKIAGPGAIISYAIGSMIAAIIAACAGEMSVRHPVQGGFGTIASRYLNPFSGYITRWAYWACTVPLAGAELVAVGHYVAFWFPQVPLWASVTFFGVLILVLNLVSVKSFGALEFLLSSIKVSAVIVFMVIGLLLVLVGLPNHGAAGVQNLVSEGGFLPNGPMSIWISMAVVMFSFGGVEMISLSAAEAKDPSRSVRSSAKAMMIRLATFYVLAVLIVVAVIPWRSASSLGDAVEASPFVLVFEQLGVHGVAHFVNFVVLIAALSSANANLYAGARLLHSLAVDGMAPRPLAGVNRAGVPARAVWLSTSGMVIAILLALYSPKEAFLSMIFVIMVCALTVWVLILFAYIVYKRVEPAAHGFRLWGGRFTAGVGIVLLFAVWVALFRVRGSAIPSVVGVGYFVVLSVLYFARIRHSHTIDDQTFAEAQRATEGYDVAQHDADHALETAAKLGR